jgi:hypothetical protein
MDGGPAVEALAIVIDMEPGTRGWSLLGEYSGG